MLTSDAIVVIVLYRRAKRRFWIGGRRGRNAAVVFVFMPVAVLALFMPHMSEALASSIIAALAGLAEPFHMLAAFSLPFFLRPS